MAQFSKQEQNQIKCDTIRRAKEMQQHILLPQDQPTPPYFPLPQRETSHEALPRDDPPKHHAYLSKSTNSIPLLGGSISEKINQILSGLDGDTCLILILLLILYQDGDLKDCDKKLWMALVYLLI
ncbi:MAG: hypothetical protein LIO74_11765 [Ruminococcus sp.]|nr:hypothetical protein [Ruminococcus sp.]